MKKKITVTSPSLPPFDEYVQKIKSIWENKWLTNNGPLHTELEEKLKEYLDVKNTTLFTNGHLALSCAIKALNLTGEVITTPFTFASTTHAIVENNLTPVFCDINPINYTIDSSKIESLITNKTSAIIATHVYGNICDVEKIQQIADKYNLKVIYDSAHAFGVKYNNVGIGNFGDINMFSLHATKVFHTIEGGLLTYNDSNLKEKFNIIKNFGIKNQEDIIAIGTNAKMNEFQAAMGLCNLKYVDEEISKRKRNVQRYINNLKSIDGIKMIEYPFNIKSNYIYFPILIEPEKYGINRDELIEILAGKNIFGRKYFYPLTSDFKCYQNMFKDKVNVAREIAQNILTLPLYADLEIEEIDYICNIIKEVQK